MANDTSPQSAIDPTKTNAYAWLDLSFKAISATALVVLGVAGWLLQSQTEKAKEASDSLQREERKYVPMLRSLSLLDVELETATVGLSKVEAERPWPQRNNENNQLTFRGIGSHLRFVASSVFVPDGDPVVSIREPGFHLGLEKRIKVPLKATALMYSEMLRFRTFFPNVPRDASATLDLAPEDPRILLSNEEHPLGTLHVSPSSIPGWQAWQGNQRIVTVQKFWDIPNQNTLTDLRFALSEVIQDVLTKHPDVGDSYVQIREALDKRHSDK